jgi:ABC-type multidrug transport system permease subunit
VAPHSTLAFLGGKLAAGAAFMSVLSLAGLFVMVPVAGVSWLRLPPALLWCAFAGTALISLFTMLQFLASTARGANILTTMVLFPLMMLGGSFFPFELMPRWMAAVGRLTPNGQGVAQLRAILTGQTDPVALAIAIAAIGLPAVACFLLSARLLRGRFVTGV